jgi:hypothetical protein
MPRLNLDFDIRAESRMSPTALETISENAREYIHKLANREDGDFVHMVMALELLEYTDSDVVESLREEITDGLTQLVEHTLSDFSDDHLLLDSPVSWYLDDEVTYV